MIGRIIKIHHTTHKKKVVTRVRLQDNTPKDDGVFSFEIQWFHGKEDNYLKPFGEDAEGNPLCVLQTAWISLDRNHITTLCSWEFNTLEYRESSIARTCHECRHCPMTDGNYQEHANTICATKGKDWIYMQKVRMVPPETRSGEKLWTIEGGKGAWEKLIGSAKAVASAQERQHVPVVTFICS